MTGHSQQRQFRAGDIRHDLFGWINEFAIRFKCSEIFSDNTIEIALKQLKELFDNGSIMVSLEISTDNSNPIRIVENQEVHLNEMLSILISERKKFDNLLERHKALNFMKGGSAGRIQFKVILSKEEDGRDTVCFTDLERAPIIDLYNGRFRRSFPLSSNYKLLETTCLYGNSPKEELLLFANSLSFDMNPLKAVVSLLNTRYTGTAFRVSPAGGLITCYHNLSLEDHAPLENLWINPSVCSPSLAVAGTSLVNVEFVPCDLPILGENAKDPLDDVEPLTISLKHSDIAFLRSSSKGPFLIPCAKTLSQGESVVCIGYPGKIDNNFIRKSYSDINECQIPIDEYQDLFTFGNLSVSPGPLLAYNSTAIACEVATIPGFSGSPVCLLENPRMFIGVHYRARHGKDYTLSTSVQDVGFYQLYSTLVVPELREADLCQDDIDLVNKYLSIGTTPPLQHRL
jgi:hypothetical protein